MKIEDFEITQGENRYQSASIVKSEKMIDYDSSKKLSFLDILIINQGLNVISEFFDVNAVVTVTKTGVSAVALGKSIDEALMEAIDSNPVDFLSSNIIVSAEVNSDIAKMLKESNIVVAPKFTKNAIEYFDAHDICYVTINTPLKDYKKYISEETRVTPLGTLIQAPNLSELNKDTFKVVTKVKPTVEQIEDAVFAWKVAKHVKSQAVVIAKDLKTSAISQGLQSSFVENALDYACDKTKEAILASDLPLTIHDINASAQGRISLIIVPSASPEVVASADKFQMAIITTGLTNILL